MYDASLIGSIPLLMSSIYFRFKFGGEVPKTGWFSSIKNIRRLTTFTWISVAFLVFNEYSLYKMQKYLAVKVFPYATVDEIKRLSQDDQIAGQKMMQNQQ